MSNSLSQLLKYCLISFISQKWLHNVSFKICIILIISFSKLKHLTYTKEFVNLTAKKYLFD